MDRLSELPVHLSEKILVSMPLLDAIRTCVLSKNWQFKWTKIPKLVLDQEFINGTTQKFNLNHIVNSILVQHTGILEEIHLFIPDYPGLKKDYINQSIRMVLMRGIKKLTIDGRVFSWSSSFPTPIYLTHLELHNCAIKDNSLIGGFRNVNTLILTDVSCSFNTLSNIMCNSPILQRLTLHYLMFEGLPMTINFSKLQYLSLLGQFKYFYLWNAPNLRELDIHVSSATRHSRWAKKSLTRFFHTLVKLETLTLGFKTYQLFENARHLKMLPRGFEALRFLNLTSVDFNNIRMIHTILCFIRSSPNLHRLEITAIHTTTHRHGEKLNLDVQSDVHLTSKHLQKVYMGPIRGTKNEIKVIKFLLLCSPSLQLMSINHARNLKETIISRVTNAVSQLNRASTGATINFSPCASLDLDTPRMERNMENDSMIYALPNLLPLI